MDNLITEWKNKYYFSWKNRKLVLQEFLKESETNIFGNWENKYIAYNLNKKVFATYKRTSLTEFSNINIYFNEFAEIQIDEVLELYEMYNGHKDIEKFISLHFHKSIDMKNFGDNHNEKN